MRLYHPSAYDFARPVDSYWEATAAPLGVALPRCEGALRADVAVIGAGYTGLNAALRLTRVHGLKVIVLEAGEPGWGASGRNGGFCCPGSAKLGYQAMIARYGLDAAREFHAAQRASVDHVGDLIAAEAIAAEVTGRGELVVAHKPNRVAGLIAECDFMRDTFGETPVFLTRDELAARGTAGPHFHAGLLSEHAFGLHPLSYARGLARAALAAGVTILARSEVTAWRREAGVHVLATAHGEVRAPKVFLAANGYADEAVPAWIGGRLLPALSRIIVTRRLTADELAAQGWTRTDLAFDTRNLLHYFRLLPDGRFLFGGRGGTDAAPAALARITATLRARFEELFPAWAGVETEHAWAGLVCLSASLTPYAGPLGDLEQAWGAFAYHGNGVAMGSYCGARMADVIAGARPLEAAVPAVVRRPMRRFVLPGLRLAYLKAAYAGFTVKDEVL